MNLGCRGWSSSTVRTSLTVVFSTDSLTNGWAPYVVDIDASRFRKRHHAAVQAAAYGYDRHVLAYRLHFWRARLRSGRGTAGDRETMAVEMGGSMNVSEPAADVSEGCESLLDTSFMRRLPFFAARSAVPGEAPSVRRAPPLERSARGTNSPWRRLRISVASRERPRIR